MRSIKPLSFAILVVLTACTQQPSPGASASAPAGLSEASAGHAAGDLGATSTLKLSDLDKSIDVCQDLAGFVNNKWLAANPIPADRSTWGSFEMLGDRSQNAQKAILEGLQHAKPARGSIEQLVGDFYTSGMDEKQINGTPATEKLKPFLAPIDAIKTPADIVAYIDANYTKGVVDVFGFGGQPDFKDSSMVIGYAGGGGTNLPERAYYLEDQYKDIRDAYVAHIEKTLELGGVPAADAKQQAAWAMAVETELATASLTPIEARDTANQYKMTTVADADKLTPHFAWEKFFDGIGVKLAHFSIALALVASLIHATFWMRALSALRRLVTSSSAEALASGVKYCLTYNCPSASPVSSFTVASTRFQRGFCSFWPCRVLL